MIKKVVKLSPDKKSLVIEENLMIEEDIISDFTIGNIKAGDLIEAGTSGQEFAEQMLLGIFNPEYVNPSFSLSHNVGKMEIGSFVNLTLTGNFNRGAINIKNGNGVQTKQNDRAGAPISYNIAGVISDSPTRIISNYQVMPTNNFNARVDYSQGPQPKNNKGEDYGSPYPAGALTTSTSFQGYYRIYASMIPNIPTNGSDIRNIITTPIRYNDTNVITMTIQPRLHKCILIAVPQGKTLKSIKNEGTNETIVVPLNPQLTQIPDAAGRMVNYNVYTREFPDTFPTQYELTITFQ